MSAQLLSWHISAIVNCSNKILKLSLKSRNVCWMNVQVSSGFSGENLTATHSVCGRNELCQQHNLEAGLKTSCCFYCCEGCLVIGKEM